MARPARDAVRHKPKCEGSSDSRGLFSNVFSFVSREFESFVVNATGGQVNIASSSTTKSEKPSSRRRKHERRTRDIHLSEDEAHQGSRHHRERRRSSKTNTARPKSRSKLTDAARKHHRKHISTAYVEDADEELFASDHPQSQPLPPRQEQPIPPSNQTLSASLPTLRKKPSITMPGSLFSRTSSLEPEESAAQLGCTSSTTDPADGGKTRPTAASLDAYVSPWRTRPVASVQDAMQRFNVTSGDEADFSLRIPSPQPSPANPRAVPFPGAEAHPLSPSGSPRPQLSSKGKERMQDDDLMFIVGGTSDSVQVEAKERELASAKEEQRQRENPACEAGGSGAPDEHERDKQRIKMLEEEVKRLREELSRSLGRSSAPGLPPSPPPPPPPPPPLPAPLPIRIDTRSSNPDALFANARAALRHTTHPVEAPINHSVLGRSGSKRRGQPTVNVPSDQMAAFLNELKTARLRKVNTAPASTTGVATTSTRQAPESSTLSKSTSALSWASGPIRPATQELTRRRSLANLRDAAPNLLAKELLLKAGQKRKADAMECDELSVSRTVKRRLIQSSSDVTAPSGGRIQLSASTSKLHEPDFGKQTWSSLSTNEIDLTTPSLCSDNERDGDGSLEDQTPSTPPGPQPSVIERRSDLREPDIIDVDLELEDVSRDSRPRAISPGPRSPRLPKGDMFEKRPPMSPIPDSTPRKPAAPARARRVSTPKPKYVPPASDSDSDTNSRNVDSVPFISLIPPSQEKSRKRLSVHGGQSFKPRSKDDRRPPTLDEELRIAQPEAAGAGGAELFEDDVFVATGTKNNRKGFLAHGGGGGPPVFMGVGYVQGAEDSDTEVRRKQPHKVPKSTSQQSLIPRLGGRS